ncbi:hypothetical protein [Streptomyces sp. NPDC060366]|uniref:hypothetical protein n=1 Tax=Streptomyces sp. NPDC060366 TaxID=3347105 RepID=UPI00365B367A
MTEPAPFVAWFVRTRARPCTRLRQRVEGLIAAAANRPDVSDTLPARPAPGDRNLHEIANHCG